MSVDQVIERVHAFLVGSSQWFGSLGDWASGLGAIGALIFAGRVYRLDRARARATQARNINDWVDEYDNLLIKNSSESIVTDLDVRLPRVVLSDRQVEAELRAYGRTSDGRYVNEKPDIGTRIRHALYVHAKDIYFIRIALGLNLIRAYDGYFIAAPFALEPGEKVKTSIALRFTGSDNDIYYERFKGRVDVLFRDSAGIRWVYTETRYGFRLSRAAEQRPYFINRGQTRANRYRARPDSSQPLPMRFVKSRTSDIRPRVEDNFGGGVESALSPALGWPGPKALDRLRRQTLRQSSSSEHFNGGSERV